MNICTLLVVALIAGTAFVQGQGLTDEEQALFDKLQAKNDAGARARKNTPAVVTNDGDVQIVVEDGKRVGYKIGEKVVNFEDLPEQWQQNDAGILEAIQLGFNMGQASPSATGLVSYINETQAEKIAALDQRIVDTLSKSDTELKEAAAATADELKESLATFQECSVKGLGYVDGACASRSWVIAEASDDVACTDDNTGALRYAVKGGGLELCAGKADGWSAVSPPSLGKNAANAGQDCATLKKAGVNTGNGLYWLNPKEPTLTFCDMSGNGEAVGDGSTKDLSAPSCFELQQFYFALGAKFKKFWVGSVQVACAIQDGQVQREGDGKTAATAGTSCQTILDIFGSLKDKEERFLKGRSEKAVCFLSADGKKATSVAPIACENKESPSEYRLPYSCKEISAKCEGADNGAWWVQAKGYGKIKVICDMKTKSSNDQKSGWMRAFTSDLQSISKASCKCNAGCSFNWECDSFYSYPNSNDYEVWNNFDLKQPFTEVRGFLEYSPQCGGHNNGCGTGGAHPDNGWYGFQKDSDYNDLGAGGEGGGNKAWHRWGIPGKVIQGGPELGWDGQYAGNPRTTTKVEVAGLKEGSVLRISSSSESGAPPCERFMIKTRLWVR